MTQTPPPSPVHKVTEPHQGIKITREIELKWDAILKRSARTVPTLEERIQELLRITDHPDTIRHICQLYPFRDQNIPRTVLSRRWDSCLDSPLISLPGLRHAQDILRLSGEEKAEKLLKLFDPVQERKSTMWAWTPPVLSGKPDDISEAIHNVIAPAVFQVTLREWLAYLNGNKVAAVDSLLIAFRSISTHINQLDPQKYNMLKKMLHSGDPLGFCILNPDRSEQILREFFLPAEEAMNHRNASILMEQLVLLNERYTAMAGYGRGKWHCLWMNLEDSNAPKGPSINSQSSQGREPLVCNTFWTVLDAVVFAFVRICESLRTHGQRSNPVLDVEKRLQNHEACT